MVAEIALLAAPASALPGCASYPVTGTFASSRGMLGAWTIASDACRASLSDEGAGLVTVVHFGRESAFHDVPTVSPYYTLDVVTVAGQIASVSMSRAQPMRSVQVSAAQCTRADARFEPGPDGRVIADVELDCDAGNGEHLSAAIHGARCF
jgi:hypothetical protein